MQLALYHPEHGYYLAPERRPGRGGDFLTAPEASAYFGVTVARQIAECWDRLGRPERFVIREYGVDPTWLLTGEYQSSSHRVAIEGDQLPAPLRAFIAYRRGSISDPPPEHFRAAGQN